MGHIQNAFSLIGHEEKLDVNLWGTPLPKHSLRILDVSTELRLRCEEGTLTSLLSKKCPCLGGFYLIRHISIIFGSRTLFVGSGTTGREKLSVNPSVDWKKS